MNVGASLGGRPRFAAARGAHGGGRPYNNGLEAF